MTSTTSSTCKTATWDLSWVTPQARACQRPWLWPGPAVLRAIAQSSDSPGEVLKRANDALVADIPQHVHYLLLRCSRPETGRLRYANAGHDLPYVRQGGDDERAQGRDALGPHAGDGLRAEGTSSEAGNSVFFYSDGLVEAHDREGEMFGFPRLRRLIAANSVGSGEELVGTPRGTPLFRWRGWEQEDDITLTTLYRSEG